MADDVARAVGAGSPTTVMIAGKECRPRPLTLKELGELERDCLKQYRISYVQTFADTIDFLPENQREGVIQKAQMDAAKLDLKALPARYVFDPKKIKITDDLRNWLTDNMDGYLSVDVKPNKLTEHLQSVTAAALDGDLLTEQEYESLTKEKCKKTKVGYVNWWTTGTFEGRLAMAWTCFREYGVTLDEVSLALSEKPDVLLNTAREIENLTSPAVGNG